MTDWRNDPMAREFIRRLSELSRETGIRVMGMGDWPELERLRPEECTARFGYELQSWGHIEWGSLMDMTEIKKRPLIDILKEVAQPIPTSAWSQELVDAIYDPTLPRFDALDWFKPSGRGDVAIVTLDRDCKRSEMLSLFACVLIDGKEYAVKGVECFAVEHQHKGWTIGLLVDEVKRSI